MRDEYHSGCNGKPLECFTMGNDFITFRIYNHSCWHIEAKRKETTEIEMESGNHIGDNSCCLVSVTAKFD